MLRRIFIAYVRFIGRRKNYLLLVLVTAWSLLALSGWRWLAAVGIRALLPPPPPDQYLQHLRRNRNLAYYLDSIQLLIEPSSHACTGLEAISIIVLVATAPSHFEHRQAIRRTWAKHQPTYFILGLDGVNVDEQLVEIYIEAKQYSDMVVYEFQDHYQNLTLKTALMMQWTLARCGHAQFLYKVDDDVFVNPWKLAEAVRENEDAKLLGYKMVGNKVHRDGYTKWYMPRWLYPEETIPEFLAGPGYLINMDNLQKIFNAAHMTPLVNLEDVYFTYCVAKKSLNLQLTHEQRLSPYKPWLPLACGYWGLAAAHSLRPYEMVGVWEKVAEIRRSNRSDACSHYNGFYGGLF